MLTTRNNQRGFSLIELIVGVMLIGILAAVGVPSFMTWTQNAQLRTAAETISNGLQLSRAEAVRRNAPIQFSLTGTSAVDSTWTVGCAASTATCPAIIQARSGVEGTRNAVVNADVAAVSFNGLGRASSAMTINVTNPTGGNCMAANGPMRCLNVLVSTGGSVRMCNPALPSSNPQGC